VFLGASYFRAQGMGEPHEAVRRLRKGLHQYGVSGRGLALDSGLAKAEEFPVFRESWIEKPRPDSTSLTLFALLNSPSVAGRPPVCDSPGDRGEHGRQMPAVMRQVSSARHRAFDQRVHLRSEQRSLPGRHFAGKCTTRTVCSSMRATGRRPGGH
jgi:Periplasmic glucan biosynthesis protein, MdoG